MKSYFEKRIEGQEWLLNAWTIVFWMAIAIVTISYLVGWSIILPLVGACIAAQYRVYFAALSAFGRGGLSAIDKELTKEDIEGYKGHGRRTKEEY